jgi:hypothetical protein
VPARNSQRCERSSVNYGNDTPRANATCGVDSVGGRLNGSSHKAVCCEQMTNREDYAMQLAELRERDRDQHQSILGYWLVLFCE